MNLLPPRVLGPLSECSRNVIVANASPGSTVSLVVTRNGANRTVGKKSVTNTKDSIPLDPTESLVGGDLVNAIQALSGDQSPVSTDGPEVQKSVAQFDAVQVLSHLHQCSRGFFLGGMRPGTTAQVLQGAAVIGTGDAMDGTAYVNIPNGLPLVGMGVLIARQLICPKPPPPPPSTAYVVDTPLPAVDAIPFHPGQPLPAPNILQGLTGCSRSIQVDSIQPGADVIVEGTDNGWWASLGASDQTTAWIPLPVKLQQGESVSIRQEVSQRCELLPDRKTAKVGPQKKLDKADLAQIACNTTPTIYVLGLKPEADIEFSVVLNGVEKIYRSAATQNYGPVPAPPMPPRSTVMVRQGECNLWSDWSASQTANPAAGPPTTPKISHTPFACQDAVPVENISPLNGYMRVLSTKYGELNKVPISGNIMVISVAPSLNAPDDITIEHHFCGYVGKDRKSVQPSRDVVPGKIEPPLFDGDKTVTISGAIAGAHMELWEETKNQLLEQVRSPFSDTGTVKFNFSGFGTLQAGWKIYAKTWHCGHYVQTAPSIPVGFRAPVLASITPSNAVAGSAGFTLTAKGNYFRPGAKVQWKGSDRPSTFISSTEIHATISTADLTTAASAAVRIVNPDGQASGTITFTVAAPQPVGYDELRIQNCNTGTFPYSNTHRPIHIFFRRTDQGPPGAWTPIWDSPHDADYNDNGFCPASPTSGAVFTLDDGATYEVVCTDWDLPGCITQDPDQIACRKSQIIVVRGKAGGGTKTVIIN